ncbi:MAG: hypothetical protein JNN08_13485 [Bryobacterales bacterium]|nr:hypothetical protein [Bryobacterales bacterium]
MGPGYRVGGYRSSRFRIATVAGFVLSTALVCFAPALAQEYMISTVAGGSPPSTPSLGTLASIFPPAGLTVDSQGNIFFSSNNCIFKLDRNGTLTRVAGTARPGYSGDGGPALAAQLNNPESLVVDRFGNIYFVDRWNYRIRRISPEGVITTFAGTGWVFALNPPEEGTPAPATPLRRVSGLAVDRAGNLYYIDDYGECRIRRISRSGLITTIAGGGNAAPDDGSVATAVLLRNVTGIAVDDSGNFFLSVDSIDANRVLKVDARGVISTVAGTGPRGSSGDGGPALSAHLSGPGALTIDEAGNLFIADRGNYRVRRVSADGTISTTAGGGSAFPGDRTKATEINFCFDDRSLSALANDRDGNLYIAACWVQKVGPDGILSLLAGNGTYSIGGDGGPATSAQFFGPTGLARDRSGNLYVADIGNNLVRKVTPEGIIQTVAGTGEDGFGGDGGPAAEATLNAPRSVVADSEGALYISDSLNCRIRKVSADGRITTIAGTGGRGASADGAEALQANICPGALALDTQGNLLFNDQGSRIRKIDGTGIITTVAGNGQFGFSGDGGPATDASLYEPWSLAVDKSNNLLFTDTVNNRIRKVSPDGIISTIAGVSATSFSTIVGDGGPATEAVVFSPTSVAVDSNGNILISDLGGLRRITPDGIITTIARNTNPRQSVGDGGPASRAYLRPGALAIGEGGRIYVVDHGYGIGGSQRTADASIRALDPTNETVILTSVRDAATQAATPISPGKIVVLYGVGMGPPRMLQNRPVAGIYTSELAGTEVLVNGVSAPILYTSSDQVAAIVPESATGSVAQVIVKFQGRVSLPLSVHVAPSSPGIFSANGTGAGQAAALNPDGSYNDAAHPGRPGEALTLFITGEGRTSPAAQMLAATVGGLAARVQRTASQTPGLLQVVMEIPPGVEPGGYVPVAVQVAGVSSPIGASWIAIAAPNPLVLTAR